MDTELQKVVYQTSPIHAALRPTSPVVPAFVSMSLLGGLLLALQGPGSSERSLGCLPRAMAIQLHSPMEQEDLPLPKESIPPVLPPHVEPKAGFGADGPGGPVQESGFHGGGRRGDSQGDSSEGSSDLLPLTMNLPAFQTEASPHLDLAPTGSDPMAPFSTPRDDKRVRGTASGWGQGQGDGLGDGYGGGLGSARGEPPREPKLLRSPSVPTYFFKRRQTPTVLVVRFRIELDASGLPTQINPLAGDPKLFWHCIQVLQRWQWERPGDCGQKVPFVIHVSLLPTFLAPQG